MIVRRISLLVFLIFVFASFFSVLFAEEEKHGPIFAVTEENDLLSNPFTADHTDRHYTQGLKLTYLGGDDEMPGWAAKVADALPTVVIDVNARNLGYAFGENMYTPENLLTRELITNDRPYAGWLYVGALLQRRGVAGDARIPVLESLKSIWALPASHHWPRRRRRISTAFFSQPTFRRAGTISLPPSPVCS